MAVNNLLLLVLHYFNTSTQGQLRRLGYITESWQ